MSHENFLFSKKIWKATYFYDIRSAKVSEISEFVKSKNFENIVNSLTEETFISLGWDGLFVFIAKMAHQEQKKVLWINFWNLGFLVQEKEVFASQNLNFITKKYPILKVIINFDSWKKIEDFAFNEIYLTRSWESSSINLEISHLWKKIPNFLWDWLMISTPAGSTWWSKSYSGIILPHNANLNILTPIWTIFPLHFKSVVLCDKWRIYIKNISKRQGSIDLLVDNKRILSEEKGKFEIIIERDKYFAEVLIKKENLKKFEAKVYELQGFNFCFK